SARSRSGPAQRTVCRGGPVWMSALSARLRRRHRRGDERFTPAAATLALAGLGGVAGARRGARFARIDVTLLAVVAALLMFGAVMVYSASIALADSPRYNVTPVHFVIRHAISMLLGAGAAAGAFGIPLAHWQRVARWGFLAGVLLLVAVLVPGVGRGALGARRWIALGPLSLQPSELMKLACVLYAADFTVRKQDYMHDFGKGF